MLCDAEENIDWRTVDPAELDAPPVYTAQIPSPPRENEEWDYHRWVLSNIGWYAFYNPKGRPVQPAGPTSMPPPHYKAPPPHHEPPYCDLMEQDGPIFSIDDFEDLEHADSLHSDAGRYPM